jgi:hypothetical protein
MVETFSHAGCPDALLLGLEIIRILSDATVTVSW